MFRVCVCVCVLVCVSAGVRARLLHSFTARDIKMVYLGVHPCPPLSLSYFCVLSTASMFQHFLYRKFQCCRDDQANLNRWNFKRYVLELITAVQSLKVFQMKVMWIVGAIMNMVRPKIGRICSKKNLSKRVASEIPPQQDNLRNTEFRMYISPPQFLYQKLRGGNIHRGEGPYASSSPPF